MPPSSGSGVGKVPKTVAVKMHKPAKIMVIGLISNAQFKRAGLHVKQNCWFGFCLLIYGPSVFNWWPQMPKRTDIHSVLIIGAGPIIIGQACEFDYSGTQACKALKEEGYRVILINSNPATIMTDPEFADRTYIEPITPECVEKIIVRELNEMKRLGVPVQRAAGVPPAVPYKLVLLPTLGGQTALNTAMALHKNGALKRHGIEMIGAKAEAIQKGEDRQIFKDLMLSIGLDVPISGVARDMDEARDV